MSAPSTAAAARLDVDLAAVAANTRLLVGRTRAAVMAVVKADAFGHGAVDVARTALAHGARWLGVTSVDEALALRAADLDARTLSWLDPVDADLAAALRARVDLAVPDVAHLDAVARAAAATGLVARVHLHVDTGMARDGAAPAEWGALCRRARAAEVAGLVDVAGVMGHLPCADEPLHPSNAAGRSLFVRALRDARAAGITVRLRHLAATAATLTDPRTHLDVVRLGAGIVGLEPVGGTHAAGAGLVGALTLTAPVVGVRRVGAGTGVGYGHAYVTDAPTWLGLLPLGYADGIPRAATGTGSRAQVWLPGPGGGRRVPVVGVASMDQVVVDLGHTPVPLGTVATVFGPGSDGEPTVTEWARWAGTLPHELTTGIGPRVARRVLPAADPEPRPVGASGRSAVGGTRDPRADVTGAVAAARGAGRPHPGRVVRVPRSPHPAGAQAGAQAPSALSAPSAPSALSGAAR